MRPRSDMFRGFFRRFAGAAARRIKRASSGHTERKAGRKEDSILNRNEKLPRLHSGDQIPPRLGAALMETDATLERFSRLTEDEKREFIGGAENLHTGYELRSYVRSFMTRGEDLR